MSHCEAIGGARQTSEGDFYADIDEDEDSHDVKRAQLEHLFVLVVLAVTCGRPCTVRRSLSDLRKTGCRCQGRT